MRRRRMLVVGLALVLGALAGGIAYAYLNGVQRRAFANAQLVSVYVASEPIPRGTTGAAAFAAGLIHRTEMPVEFRPAGAITGQQAIASDVALANIASQQVIVSTLFGEVDETGGAAAGSIPRGDVAISVSADAVHSVSGLIEPGDDVDIMVELTPSGREAVLYQDVPVLATGSELADTTGETTGSGTSTTSESSGTSGLITFAVPLDAAQRIAMAASGDGALDGSLYLVLVPPGSAAGPTGALAPQDLVPTAPTPK